MMTEPSPSEAAVGLAVPTLPWHHLSALVCLTRGSSVPKDATGSPSTNLLKRLLAGTDAALLDACAPDQSTSTPNGLFSHVRVLGQAASYPYFGWNVFGPSGFPIKLRTGTGDPFLTPDALVLRWPDGGFGTSDEVAIAARYEAARVPAGKPPIPSPQPAEVSTATGLPLSAFMLAVDDALDPLSPCRDAFGAIKDDDAEARKWLFDRAQSKHGGPATYPASLTVHVDESLYTTQTRWEVRGTGAGRHLHLEMGWLEQKGMDKILINQWPCGAFQGFVYQAETTC